MKKNITITFDLMQVCNDILAKCNVISKTIKDEAMADIKADIATPDGDETRSIINRSITEAWGNIKIAAQRYLLSGRTVDNNNLERLVHQKDDSTVDTGDGEVDLDNYIFEKLKLELLIPNFNIAVTDGMKSHLHRYLVDYTLAMFLQDLHPDNSAKYSGLADNDMEAFRHDLLARDTFLNRRPSFT